MLTDMRWLPFSAFSVVSATEKSRCLSVLLNVALVSDSILTKSDIFLYPLRPSGFTMALRSFIKATSHCGAQKNLSANSFALIGREV